MAMRADDSVDNAAVSVETVVLTEAFWVLAAVDTVGIIAASEVVREMMLDT